MIDLPLTFAPILVPKVWGGRRLEALGKDLPAGEAIGESWEMADLPGDGPSSIVDDGPLAGISLRRLLEQDRQAVMGRTPLDAQGRFPLLIKFLDACDNLSVQVHPDQAWADAHDDAHLKSEAWVVMDALPDSRIWAGVVPGTTPASMRAALDEGRLTDVLTWREARTGSCHSLPSGTCHALGAGVLVAEVQTTSDTTFRLWDWGRTGRTMHVDESLACIDFGGAPPAESAPSTTSSTLTDEVVADTPWFVMRRINAATEATWSRPGDDTPVVVMGLDGSCTAHGVAIPRGRTALVPACLGDLTIDLDAGASVLVAEPG